MDWFPADLSAFLGLISSPRAAYCALLQPLKQLQQQQHLYCMAAAACGFVGAVSFLKSKGGDERLLCMLQERTGEGKKEKRSAFTHGQ